MKQLIAIVISLAGMSSSLLSIGPESSGSSSYNARKPAPLNVRRSSMYQKGRFTDTTSIRRSPSFHVSMVEHPAGIAYDKEQITQDQKGALVKVRSDTTYTTPEGDTWVRAATRFIKDATGQLVSTIEGWVPKQSIREDHRRRSTDVLENMGVITTMWCSPQEYPEYFLSLASQVTILREDEDTFLVELPNGTTGHIAQTDMDYLNKLENLPEEEKRQRICDTALFGFYGYDFTWGACSPRQENIPLETTKSPRSLQGVDCSGLTSLCYAKCGITLSPLARTQWRYAHQIFRQNLKPGDLIFIARQDEFEQSYMIAHVIMYLGRYANGEHHICDAYGPTKSVRHVLDTDCWEGEFDLSKLETGDIFEVGKFIKTEDPALKKPISQWCVFRYYIFYGSYFDTTNQTYQELYNVPDENPRVHWSDSEEDVD